MTGDRGRNTWEHGGGWHWRRSAGLPRGFPADKASTYKGKQEKVVLETLERKKNPGG